MTCVSRLACIHAGDMTDSHGRGVHYVVRVGSPASVLAEVSHAALIGVEAVSEVAVSNCSHGDGDDDGDGENAI